MVWYNFYQGVEEFDAAALGQWAEAGGGALLWGLTIRSLGKKSQMLLFRQASHESTTLV